MGSPSFVLADLNNLSPVFTPLRSTHRIKYTCFNVSENFIVFGATSGGLYIFKREPCSFLQLLPSKEGAVTHVTISPDEKLFAFSTVKGVVCSLGRNIIPGSHRVQISNEHQGTEVTALQWNGQSSEVYIGDGHGKISVLTISGFVAKNMFNTPSYQLMQLDSRIVQLDWQSDLLLVSTLTRSYLCDTVKERYRQIGHKLREGEYGGCFYIGGDHTLPLLTNQRPQNRGGNFISLNESEKLQVYEGLRNLKMFCARPGSRLWEVRIDGTVLSTHQFKQALAVQPTALIKMQDIPNSSQQSDNHVTNSTNIPKCDIPWSQQSFNFSNLLLLSGRYLFTFKVDGIYIFDPERASVVLWCNEITDIAEAHTQNDMIYLRTSNGNFHALLFSSLEKFLIKMYLHKQYTLCAQLCEMHSHYLMEEAPTSTKLHLLADLGTKLSNDEVAERILPLMQEISKYAQETKSARKLDSGIFVVSNEHFLHQTAKGMFMPILSEAKRADRFKDKSRSLSSSPETARRRKKSDILRNSLDSQKSGSTPSLPELGKADHEDSSKLIKDEADNNNTPDTNSRIANSPETLNALKEIGQSVSSKITSSTRSLKEKWQMFEGKILGIDSPPELLDVKTADYQDLSVNENILFTDDSEIVYSEKPKSEKSCPDLNVKHIIELSLKASDCKSNSAEELSQLTAKLFDSILYMYEEFMLSIDKMEKSQEMLYLFQEAECPKVKESMTYFLKKWKEKSFPFQNYFSPDTNKIVRERLHESLKSKVLIDWLQQWVNVVEENIHLPEQLSNIYPSQTLYLDVLLSRLLIICSDLLDPNAILQCIMESEVPCYYLSFCVVLEKYQDGAQYATTGNEIDDACWKWPLPLLLNSMFFMLQMDQIETCCKMGTNISLKNVCYLFLRLEEYMLKTGKEEACVKHHCYSLFLSYMNMAFDNGTVTTAEFQDEQILFFTSVAFEHINNNIGQSCLCGFPLPLPSPSALQFRNVGEKVFSYYWQTNHDRHLELCRKIPFMWGHVLSYKKCEDIGSLLPLIVQLGDLSELNKILPNMNPALWEKTVRLINTIQSGKCLNCGSHSLSVEALSRGMSLSTVGALMIKSLGPQATVELLMKYEGSIKSGELDARFFQSCIFSAIVDSHAHGLRSKVIDMVNDCAGSSTVSLFSPEVNKAVEDKLLKDIGKVSLSTDSSNVHHWGVCVDLGQGSCPCCSLSLSSEVLIRDGGLTVFQCGHSYHAICLQQRQCHSCLICASNS